MPEEISKLLIKYTEEITEIYGKHLRRVILYGSYARGDFREDSDIDIMILVDLPDETINSYSEQLSAATFDMNLDYDIMIMPIVKNVDHVLYWETVYPFYGNVMKEGVPLYAA